MKINVISVYNYEIVHYADSELKVFSKFNRIFIVRENKKQKIILPVNFKQKIIGVIRLSRRLFRLDKMCVLPVAEGYVAFWQGNVYHISNEGRVRHTLRMRNCRNPLHNSIVNLEGKTLYFGEYGNPSASGKSVYKSINGGISWNEVFNISCDRIKHIHACEWDPYENRVWVLTGDYEGQSYLISADENFRDIEWIGDGTQDYRTLGLVFKKDSIHWCMDSPLRDSYHIIYNRETKKIQKGQLLPGPAWYLKELSEGDVMVSTAQEIGPSHKDDKIHVLYTNDLETWTDVAQFEHDGLKKRYFKFGVIGFSDGRQDKGTFYMHAEAIKGYDGKAMLCELVDEDES